MPIDRITEEEKVMAIYGPPVLADKLNEIIDALNALTAE